MLKFLFTFIFLQFLFHFHSIQAAHQINAKIGDEQFNLGKKAFIEGIIEKYTNLANVEKALSKKLNGNGQIELQNEEYVQAKFYGLEREIKIQGTGISHNVVYAETQKQIINKKIEPENAAEIGPLFIGQILPPSHFSIEVFAIRGEEEDINAGAKQSQSKIVLANANGKAFVSQANGEFLIELGKEFEEDCHFEIKIQHEMGDKKGTIRSIARTLSESINFWKHFGLQIGSLHRPDNFVFSIKNLPSEGNEATKHFSIQITKPTHFDVPADLIRQLAPAGGFREMINKKLGKEKDETLFSLEMEKLSEKIGEQIKIFGNGGEEIPINSIEKRVKDLKQLLKTVQNRELEELQISFRNEATNSQFKFIVKYPVLSDIDNSSKSNKNPFFFNWRQWVQNFRLNAQQDSSESKIGSGHQKPIQTGKNSEADEIFVYKFDYKYEELIKRIKAFEIEQSRIEKGEWLMAAAVAYQQKQAKMHENKDKTPILAGLIYNEKREKYEEIINEGVERQTIQMEYNTAKCTKSIRKAVEWICKPRALFQSMVPFYKFFCDSATDLLAKCEHRAKSVNERHFNSKMEIIYKKMDEIIEKVVEKRGKREREGGLAANILVNIKNLFIGFGPMAQSAYKEFEKEMGKTMKNGADKINYSRIANLFGKLYEKQEEDIAGGNAKVEENLASEVAKLVKEGNEEGEIMEKGQQKQRNKNIFMGRRKKRMIETKSGGTEKQEVEWNIDEQQTGEGAERNIQMETFEGNDPRGHGEESPTSAEEESFRFPTQIGIDIDTIGDEEIEVESGPRQRNVAHFVDPEIDEEHPRSPMLSPGIRKRNEAISNLKYILGISSFLSVFWICSLTIMGANFKGSPFVEINYEPNESTWTIDGKEHHGHKGHEHFTKLYFQVLYPSIGLTGILAIALLVVLFLCRHH